MGRKFELEYFLSSYFTGLAKKKNLLMCTNAWAQRETNCT